MTEQNGRVEISLSLPQILYDKLRELKYKRVISSHNACIIEALLDYFEKVASEDVPKGE